MVDCNIIYLCICQSNRTAVLLLCYSSTALFISKGDINDSSICHISGFIFSCYIVRPSCDSLATSVILPIAFIFTTFCCILLKSNYSNVLNYKHEHTHLQFQTRMIQYQDSQTEKLRETWRYACQHAQEFIRCSLCTLLWILPTYSNLKEISN